MNLSKPRTLRSLLLALSTVAVATGAIACSGSGSSGNEPAASNAAAANSSGNTGGKGGGAGGGTSGGSTGSDSGTGGDPGADAGVAPTKVGVITVSQTYAAATKTYSHTSTAMFISAMADVGAVASACTTTTEGICQVTSCPPPKPVEAGTPPPPVDAGVVYSPNAGKLTLSGPTLPTDIALIPFTDTGMYPSKSAATQAWNGGDSFGFEAAGNDVKSFNAQLIAPAQLAVTGPAPTNGIYNFSRKADFVVTFTGGDATTEGTVQLIGLDDDKNSINAVCTAPTKGGTIVVPVDAVGYFGTKGSGAFIVSTNASKVLKSSGYDVTLSLSASALSGAFMTND